MPVLGLGTWHMGEDSRKRDTEVAALRLGLELGMTLVDTAEMYGSGEAETIVKDAVRGLRERTFIVSKVLPENASRSGTLRACERSLKRLDTDWIDLYLLHWAGPHPLEQTLEAFTRLAAEGKIRHFGLSNFDVDEMKVAGKLTGGSEICADQVLYNLERRGIERKLLPWCDEKGVVLMAYSPLEQGRLRKTKELTRIARSHGVTASCVALAWTIRREGVVAIPKASSTGHVRENLIAAGLKLTPEDLAALDREFPPPPRDVTLEVL